MYTYTEAVQVSKQFPLWPLYKFAISFLIPCYMLFLNSSGILSLLSKQNKADRFELISDIVRKQQEIEKKL